MSGPVPWYAVRRKEWQLTGPWPAWGDVCLPASTVVEAETSVLMEGPKAYWNGRPVPFPLPIEAMPMDNDAARVTRQWYADTPERNRLRFGPGVE